MSLLDEKHFRRFVGELFPSTPAPAKRTVDRSPAARTMHKDLKKRIKRLRNNVRSK